MSDNDKNRPDVKIGTEEVELTPEKFIGIIQEDNERDFLTTGNFSVSELKYIRNSFLEFVEEIMLNNVTPPKDVVQTHI